MAYPLDVFSKKNKNTYKLKNDIRSILEILCEKLKNWKEFKPIRGIIEDFFKVGKHALKFYGNSTVTQQNPCIEKIYLCFLLIVLVTQEGYKTKTQLQRLSEGDVVQNTPVKTKPKKNKNKTETTNKKPAPKKTKQNKLKISKKERQKTLKQSTLI